MMILKEHICNVSINLEREISIFNKTQLNVYVFLRFVFEIKHKFLDSAHDEYFMVMGC